ncbi:MAG: hypothetical protein ACRERV_09300 [Methylococcales bacterium]
MPDINDSDFLRAAGQIECYLHNHPFAADSIEGIEKWWLPAHGIEVSRVMVQQALDHLCSKSVLTCNVNRAGNKIYSSKPAKAE